MLCKNWLKEGWSAILILDQVVHFRTRGTSIDGDEYFIVIKRLIHQRELKTLNKYVYNNRVLIYTEGKQKWMEQRQSHDYSWRARDSYLSNWGKKTKK